jgi:hypothetical protein
MQLVPVWFMATFGADPLDAPTEVLGLVAEQAEVGGGR